MGGGIAHADERAEAQTTDMALDPVQAWQGGYVDDSIGIAQMLTHELHHVRAARKEVGTGLSSAVGSVARARRGRGSKVERAGVGKRNHRQPSAPAASRIAATMLV